MDAPKIATIILAGGKGTRLFPLTHHHCKPAVSFAGRYRLIDIPISNSIHSNFTQIFVLAQYLSDELHHHISQTYRFGMFQSGSIDLLTPQENEKGERTWFEGTADAVRKSLSTLLKSEADYFLILSGDQLYHIDFRAMAAFLQELDADIAIASTPVPRAHSERFGILRIDGRGFIQEFLEKPKSDANLDPFHLPNHSEPHLLASMGIYLFKREALIALLKSDPREDFGRHLFATAIRQWKTAAYIYDGYWEDIGTIESYYEATLLLTSNGGGVNLYDEKKPIYARPTFLPGPKIRNARVNDSILCDGSRIDAAEIDRCVIGMRSHVMKDSILRGTILLGNLEDHELSIGENCRIERAIIDENAHIGNNVTLINESGRENFDGDGVYIRDGIIIVAANARVKDNFKL